MSHEETTSEPTLRDILSNFELELFKMSRSQIKEKKSNCSRLGVKEIVTANCHV
jgi:hypothetical protein